MNKRRMLAWCIACSPMVAAAYEVGTHAYAAKLSTDASVLSPTHSKSIVPVLGIERLDDVMPLVGRYNAPILDHRYFDNPSTPTIELGSSAALDQIERYTQNEEGVIFERFIPRGYLPGISNRSDFEHRIAAWVMRGAIREDDNDVGPYSLGDRDDDPWGVVFRAGRHFYDPANERALDSGPTCTSFGCLRAPEWALGRTNVLSGPGTITGSSENHFSWQHARNQYWWALTYKPSDIGVNSYGQAQRRFSASRSKRFASVFKSVGQVVHLVQDMGQPQHTRNDSHGPPFVSQLTGDSAADGAFEAFTEARLFRELPEPGYSSPLTHFDGSKLTVDDLPPLRMRGAVPYAVPTFSKIVHYFTTRGVDPALAARRGLADVSNRGFFTATTLPNNVETGSPDPLAENFRAAPPLPTEQPGFYEEFPLATKLYASGTVVRTRHLVAQVPDALAPNWNSQSGLFTEYSVDGRMPLVTVSQTRLGDDLIAVPTPETESTEYSMSYDVFTATANAMLPRAVAYGTGVIDHFFRGRLEVTPTAQNAFAVLNQGEPHTVDAEGYPRRPNNSIFGFEKVRLRVRNVTEAITESGSPAPAVSQTSGSGTLVAVAKYHRNACYQPTMTGERTIAFSGVITEPTCSGSTPQRTDLQEISVSAPITISSAADLPGGVGSGGGAPPAVEKLFDFSADPIPVNATDLFIQVVYRGQLGDEPDGMAVGTYDVREPTFVGVYNSTDYFWNHVISGWVIHGQIATYEWRNADHLSVCTGPGGDSRWAFYGEPVGISPFLGIPSPNPGVLRLAIIFANPVATQFVVRVIPTVSDGPDPAQRSYFTRGQQRQSNKEIIDSAVLNAPQHCTQTPPTGSTYWCNDPIKRRRGVRFGEVAAPIYFDTAQGLENGPDVDAQPLPQFPGHIMATTGTIKWNDAVLSACPPPPTSLQGSQEMTELIEEATLNGVELD